MLQKLVLCVPLLYGWWGRCGQQIQANVQAPMKQNASPVAHSEAPRRRWRPGQEQHPGQANQDSRHMLSQPRGSSAERLFLKLGGRLGFFLLGGRGSSRRQEGGVWFFCENPRKRG